MFFGTEALKIFAISPHISWELIKLKVFKGKVEFNEDNTVTQIPILSMS